MIRTALHDKERVPVPVASGTPHALAKETGCPRPPPPDARPLAQRGLEGKIATQALG